MKALLRLIACTSLVCTSFAQAGVNTWTPFGPEGGNASDVQFPRVDRLYAVGGSIIYLSDNQGTNWRPIMNGLPQSPAFSIKLAASINNADVAYVVFQSDDQVTFQRVFKTTNAGLRWSRVPFPLPPGALIRDLSIDPINSDRIIITTSLPGSAGVAISADGGANFSSPSVASGYPQGASSATFTATRHGAIAYAAVRATLAAGALQVFRSSDSGVNWAPTATLPTTVRTLFQLRTSLNSQNTVYGSGYDSPDPCIDPCDDGVSTINGGTSWSARSSLISPPWISPSNANTLMQAFYPGSVSLSTNSGALFTQLVAGTRLLSRVSASSNYPATPTFFAASFTDGIFRSINNGANVSRVNDGFSGKTIAALAISKGAGTVANPNYTLFAGADSEFTSDGVNSRLIPSITPPGAWIERPVASLNSSGVVAMATDLTANTHVYAGDNFNRFLRSVDNGVSWAQANTPSPGIGSVHAIALDERSCTAPPVSGICTTGPLQTIYIGGNNSPNAGLGSNAFAIYKSTNAGVSFTVASAGINRPSVSSLTLRVTDIAADRSATPILYAATSIIGTGAIGTNASGVYKSTNGGSSWTSINTGLPQVAGGGVNTIHNVTAIEVAPDDNAVLYATVVNNLVSPGAVSGIYKSTNSGASWALTGLSRRAVRDIAIDRNDSSRIYVAVSGTGAEPGGVARSLDSGATWNSISTALPASGAFKIVARGSQLYVGAIAGVYAFFQGPDADLDNVETSVEDAAPNGGDLNNDGIADSTQSGTASFLVKTVDDDETRRAPEGRTNYGNADIDKMRAVAGSCTQLNNTFGIDPEIYPIDLGASGIAYDASDLGMVNIELNDCSSATITVKFDDGNFIDPLNWKWRNYSPTTPGDNGTFAWYTFAGAQRVDNTTWRLTISANTLGVYRADSNSILLRGGPAFFPERVFTGGFEE